MTKAIETEGPYTDSSFTDYILSKNAVWFWLLNVTSVILLLSIFILPNAQIMVRTLRIITASIYILFLPGFTICRILYPSRELDLTHLTAYSIGISVSLIPVIGIFLNSTPYGINLSPIALTLVSLTEILSLIAIYREYYQRIKS